MRTWPRHLLVGLSLLLVLGFAYSPVLGAGLLGADFAVLAGAGPAGSGIAADPYAATRGPLGEASLRASRALWGIVRPGPLGLEPALALRLENLVLLLAAAWGVDRFLRRMLLPWTGSDQARAAGHASALALVFHPLCVFAVASVAARGELLALALAAWSAATFLRGRQEHRVGWTATGLVLCVLAGFASSTAVGLPVVLATAELFSAHRYRVLRVRLRTALTTFLVFGAAATLQVALAASRDGLGGLPPWVQALRRAGDDRAGALLASRAVEKLGILVLPSNPYVWGVAGTVLAGVLFLVATQPALGAARSAPRLFGWMLFVWFASLLASGLLHAHADVSARGFEVGAALLPSVAVMAVGLGIGSTALSGVPRVLLPALLVAGYAALLHGCGLPWERAGREVAALRRDLLGARETYGRDLPILVLDPPARTSGIEPIGGSLEGLIDPRLEDERDGQVAGTLAAEAAGAPRTPSARAPGSRGSTGGGEAPAGSVRPLTQAAFLALLREPEARELRRAGLLVLVPGSALPSSGGRPPSPRRAVLLRGAPAPETGGVRTWRGDPRSPALDLETLDFEGLRVEVPAQTMLDGDEVLHWRSLGPEVSESRCEGTWLDAGDQPVGIFDLGASLAWRLGGRARLVWFEGGLLRLSEASLLERLPPVGAGAPETSGEDWLFDPPTGELVPDEGARFVLALLDLGSLAYEELDVERRRTGRLRARDVLPRLSDLLAAGGPVAWSLECRVGGRTVARDRGRVAAQPRH